MKSASPAETGFHSMCLTILRNSSLPRTHRSWDSACQNRRGRAAGNLIGFSGGGTLAPSRDHRHWLQWPHRQVHPVRHHHPGAQTLVNRLPRRVHDIFVDEAGHGGARLQPCRTGIPAGLRKHLLRSDSTVISNATDPSPHLCRPLVTRAGQRSPGV
jgi:hypothetical protein